MSVLAVGDSYMPPRSFEAAFDELTAVHDDAYLRIDDPRRFLPATPSELKLRGTWDRPRSSPTVCRASRCSAVTAPGARP